MRCRRPTMKAYGQIVFALVGYFTHLTRPRVSMHPMLQFRLSEI
jgi:hypothetical protein